eukprot:TRINITY_DN9918_c0_g1_i1.p1 TRINITY_DN9918_c0_g1~~TRINITY_DN9918_c0_g1_i1.p1  ORF type:complete len:666 (-),score=108.97 TRINITY_DN9918_c0_g1_i1:145-2013(-)
MRNSLGRTALFYAAAAGRLEFVRALVDAGVDANVHDTHGMSALGYASQQWLGTAGAADGPECSLECGGEFARVLALLTDIVTKPSDVDLLYYACTGHGDVACWKKLVSRTDEAVLKMRVGIACVDGGAHDSSIIGHSIQQRCALPVDFLGRAFVKSFNKCARLGNSTHTSFLLDRPVQHLMVVRHPDPFSMSQFQPWRTSLRCRHHGGAILRVRWVPLLACVQSAPITDDRKRSMLSALVACGANPFTSLHAVRVDYHLSVTALVASEAHDFALGFHLLSEAFPAAKSSPMSVFASADVFAEHLDALLATRGRHVWSAAIRDILELCVRSHNAVRIDTVLRYLCSVGAPRGNEPARPPRLSHLAAAHRAASGAEHGCLLNDDSRAVTCGDSCSESEQPQSGDRVQVEECIAAVSSRDILESGISAVVAKVCVRRAECFRRLFGRDYALPQRLTLLKALAQDTEFASMLVVFSATLDGSLDGAAAALRAYIECLRQNSLLAHWDVHGLAMAKHDRWKSTLLGTICSLGWGHSTGKEALLRLMREVCDEVGVEMDVSFLGEKYPSEILLNEGFPHKLIEAIVRPWEPTRETEQTEAKPGRQLFDTHDVDVSGSASDTRRRCIIS